MLPFSIAYVIGQLGLGGAERQLWLLVRALRSAGHPVSVITLHPDANDYWEGPVVATGALLHKVPQHLPRPLKVLRIAAILRRVRPRVIHSWTLHTNLYAAVAGHLTGVPVRLGSERSNETYSRQVLGLLYELQLWGLDAIVTNNSPAGAFLRSHCPRLRVAMVANGVELPDAATREAVRCERRAQWGLHPSALVVGSVGSLLPDKGLMALFEAMAPLLDKMPELAVVIVGEGPLRRELEAQAAKWGRPGRILLPGAVVPVESAYQAFDVFCLPTLKEGMPNVVLEASAAGLPVVASDVGGTREVLAHAETGFLVPPGDVVQLRDRVSALLEDGALRSRLGEAGRQRMADHFSILGMVRAITALYEEMLASNGRGQGAS